MASAAIAGFFILAIACGVGFGVASADSSDDLARAGAFGFDESTHIATLAAADAGSAAQADTGTSGQWVLESPAERDISAGLAMVDAREAAAEAQAVVENAAAIERVNEGKAKQGVAATPTTGSKRVTQPSSAAQQEEEPQEANPGDLDEYNLPVVDWSVGKKAFVAEWAGRIDAYLEGTPLAGYGQTFAEASWENGVDPRWSPAISNTESGNGAHCFMPYNAWGWGDGGWPDWESAIHAHVAGLADGYGYSLTFDAAQKYCPPNCVHWYNNTLGQMRLI